MKRGLMLVVALAALPAWAALFDTIEQTEMRYGKPLTVLPAVAPANYAAVYEQGGYHVFVQFKDKRAIRIRYQRADAKPLSKEEIAALLEANREATAPWQRKGSSQWDRADQKGIARKGGPRPAQETWIEFVASDWKEALAAAPNAEAEKIRMLEMMKPLPPAMQEAARRNPEGQRAGNPQQTVAQSNPTESATPKKEGASNKPSQRIKAGRMILDRSKANIVRVHGVVTRCDPARRWPGTYYAYTGTWVKTDDGETVIVLGSNKPEAQTVGAVLDTEVRDAGSKYEGHRVMNEAVPVP